MKLLLVYPQLVNAPDQRLSRASAQLRGIARSAKSVLDDCASDNLTVETLAYDSDANSNAMDAAVTAERINASLENADIVIDVSPVPDVNITPPAYAGPVIHLSPTFGGSFVCNDIKAVGRGRLMQSDVANVAQAATQEHKFVLPSTHELDANMHYATFSPLPTRVGDGFYRNEKEHALVFLSYPAHKRNEETVNEDLIILSEILHTVESLRSVTFVCETLKDLPFIQEICDGVREALGIQASVWGLRRGEYHDMYSIMGKSSVVLAGGSSLYADAIIRGMPVYTWRTTQDGTQVLADAYSNVMNEREDITHLQKQHLTQLVEAQYLDGTVPNYLPCFEQLLRDLINQSVRENVVEQRSKNNDSPKWVIAPARYSERRELPDRMTRSLVVSRQLTLQSVARKHKASE